LSYNKLLIRYWTDIFLMAISEIKCETVWQKSVH